MGQTGEFAASSLIARQAARHFLLGMVGVLTNCCFQGINCILVLFVLLGS